jgi:phosphinothricin acetyltransferase
MDGVVIRDAVAGDVLALTALYNELGVATTVCYDLEPVTEENRAAWLAAHEAAGWPVLVAVAAGEFVGYAAYAQFREKAGFRYSVEHSVYVASAHQGEGVGRTLLAALIDRARAAGVHLMVGVIDAENAASLAFHASLGFEDCGVWPEVVWKFGRFHDLKMLVLKLG